MAACVAIAAVTNQSLWIDEGCAALKAMQPTLLGWWQLLRAEAGSNQQLLFQLCYLWGWEKLFGSSECALRASNIPWFIVAVIVLATAAKQNFRFQISLLLVTFSNAFLWYYLSEARPYIVLFAFACINTACLLHLVGTGESIPSPAWFRWFCVGLIGLIATSMIAVPWALGALTAAIFWIGPDKFRQVAWRCRSFSIFTVTAFAVCGTYYTWTITVGAPPSIVGRTTIDNIGFIAYELSGISGLGPGRNELREQGLHAFMPYLSQVAVTSLLLFIVYLAAASVLMPRTNRRTPMFIFLAIVLPFGLVFAAATVQPMRLLGRHVTPLLPFVLTFTAAGLNELFFSNRWTKRIAGFGVIALLLWSALEIRFAPRHERDNYRDAAAEARTALSRGNTVWWLADAATGSYYRLPLNSANLKATSELTRQSLDILPTPDLVCLSKPDVYDSNGRIRNYLREHNFKGTRTLPAFQIFERRSDHPQAH